MYLKLIQELKLLSENVEDGIKKLKNILQEVTVNEQMHNNPSDSPNLHLHFGD